MTNPICPKHEELSAYLVGNLDDERTSHVTSHVDDCPECQATVADLAEVAETLIGSLRGPLPEDPNESEAECREVIALVEDFGRDPSRFGDLQDSQEAPDEAELGHVREYQLLAELGKGGMGTVYKALHTKLGKVVALKVLPAERVRHADAVARFEREMKAVGALEHPHIVRATDAGEADGVHYLVMEYVPGVDLSSVLKRHGPMPVADACEVARQAAVGLEHAHQHGLIHRDVKPSNLILSGSGQVKILDLGLALLSSQVMGEGGELTSSGQMMGTLDYMAPEQGGDSHEVDARADVYSLGATLFKLLSGEAPFAGKKYDTPMKKIVALASQTAPSIAERRADLPEPLTAIIDRMLAKNPQERLATAQEVVDALAPFAEGHRLPGLVETLPKGPATPEEAIGSTAPQRAAEQIDTTSLLPSPPAAASASSGRWYRRPAVALAAGLVAAIALGMLIRIATDNGELVIESTVPDVEVLVKRVGRTGRTMEVEQGTKRTTIRSGEYEITLTGAGADELKIEGDKFTMVRGGEAIVRISRVTPESVEPESIASTVSETWPLGPADNVLPGLIGRPAERPGIGRWQLETVGPRSEILSAAFSPDGRLLALGTDRGLVRIYDSKTHKLVRLFVGHTDRVNSVAEDRVTSVAWRHDGRQLASGDYGGTVRVWDVDGALVRTFSKGAARVYSVAWHPEGKRLAWGGEGGIRISELNAIPQPFSQDYKTTVRSIAWSPDGRQLASAGDDKTVRLWNADGTPAGVFEGHEASVNCVAWSPDGQQLASACGGDKTVRLWSKDGDEGPVLTGWAGAASVAWSPDGEKVVATCQSDVQLWKKDGTKEHATRMGQNLHCVAWRPDGNSFIAVGYRGCVETLDIDGEAETLIAGHPAHFGSCAAWSPDGETLAATHDQRVWQWSRDGEFKTQFMVGGYGAGHPEWHPSGDRIATGHVDRMARVWNADGKGKPLLEIQGGDPRWSPDGQWLAANVSTAVELWDQDGTKAKTLDASPDAKIKAIAWSPDGKWLAAGGEDGKIRLWSREGQLQHVFDEHECTIYWLAWSHDSKWLASAKHNQAVCVHNVDGTAGPLLTGHVHAVLSVAWSPDDKRLATTNGYAVSLWEADGARGPVLEGHMSLVDTVDFNPKTGTLASSGDNTVRLWDGSTGEPKMTIVMLHDDRSATFSAAGQLLDGDPATVAEDFIYLVEQADGRMDLRTRLDGPGPNGEPAASQP
ncbi:MAG: protein kinase [Planctomycetes bacterium]|nr:protein kinase [Planctomycetota bacterium]